MKRDDYWYKIFGIAILLIVVILFIYTWQNRSLLQGKIGDQIETYGLGSIFALSFILDFIPQYVAPQAIVVLAHIVGFSLWKISLVVLLGSFLGSWSAFEIGNQLKSSADILEKLIGRRKIKNFEHQVNKKGKLIVLISSISPIPYIPVVLGMLHFTRRNFVIYGLIPRAVGIAISSLIVYGII